MLSAVASAETRPVRIFNTADGLPSNTITCNKRDSHGFLWFCTPEGLSRFDGYTFVNYGVEQGLPDRYVTTFLETRSGEYWIGTAGGLARFNPKPGAKEAMFTVVGDGSQKTQGVVDLLEDHYGTVWVGMQVDGLLQLSHANGQWVLSRPHLNLPSGKGVDNLFEDHQGNLWIAMYNGSAALVRRSTDGRCDTFNDVFLRNNRIFAVAEDRENNVWVGTFHGLALLVRNPKPDRELIAAVYSKWGDSMRPEASGVFQSSDGRRFVSTYVGTFEMLRNPGSGKIRFRLYDRETSGIGSVEDAAGNFWNSSRRTPRNGFTHYGLADGLAANDVRSIFEGRDGQLYVVSGLHNRFIHRFDGQRFSAVAPKVPGHASSWDWQGWGWGQTHLQDHTGEWWFATASGLLRYPKVNRLEELAHTSPKAHYRQVLDVFRLYEDSRGDIWIAWWDKNFANRLTRWQRSTRQFQDFDALLGKAQFTQATAFREDRENNLWVGHWGGGLSRYRHGRFEWVIEHGTLPTGTVFSLFLDHAGRLWAGTTRAGLLRIDDPTAEIPDRKVYSTKDGLSSNDVRAITEDHYGRIYFWTGRGIDRLDPETGRIRHYTEADGLVAPGADHNVAFCDRRGSLWFGLDGLSRLDPAPDRPNSAPPIRVTKVLVRGTEYPVSQLGETELAGLVLTPNQDQLQIEFSSLNFATGDVIKYQYKLEGADREWSTPSDLRVVNYPRLSSGRYRFLVRAINNDGLASPLPASISFRLLPPVWMRWWFLTLVSLVLSGAIYFAYRFRLQQLLELERVRTRIASDLHDDIGSSLTQIAIMSEVARRQNGHSAEPLERIADLSRELVDSMSDIVWAINPKRDQLSDLLQRMRRFANDVLEPADIEVTFRTLPERSDTPLHADMRRELFLIFKETVNNAVKHAQCQHVDILVEVKGSTLVMKIGDDGCGMPAQMRSGQGHGMISMRERARRLGGDIALTSEKGKGTTLVLTVLLEHSITSRRRSLVRS
ncbi:MAG TPA: two-component regulator propeller domain-containing protein [Candidatus Sulfotelmatobacter sp.]|nr:two-component regulator propeller domain-containing protein [Candidatus Sulfotelmatobacter sp.]